MNKIVALLCLSAAFFHCRMQAQPTNNAIKDVVMPPPNAASLGKYGDIPVSYYTGLPEIGIPVYTVTDGPLSLPVSLSYHASGLKPGELASWVGLGWSLQAGGVITRTVQGREDERAQGYFSAGPSLAVDVNGCVAAPPTYNYTNFSTGNADGEPDIFSFSVGGYSGKFFFEADKTNDGVLNPKIVLIPKQDVRIEYQLENNISSIANIRSFTLILPDGTRYLFGKTSAGAALDGIEATRTNPANNLMASSWYLRKVSSADGNYNITLDYTQEKYRYGFRAGFSSGYQSTPVNAYRENLNYVEGWRLATISSPTATVTFVAGNNREDIDNRDFNGNASANPSKVLQSIQIQSGTFCKKLDLTQTYYLDATSRKTGNDNEDKRLKLNSVQEKSCDGLVTANPYSLQYYESALAPTYLPNRLSSATDHWGFFNGAANSTSGLNIPATRLQYQNVLGEQIDMVKGNANRESMEDSMKLGTLKKIGYPTGGSTAFEYEANTYYGTRQVTTYTPAPNVLNGAWPLGQCHNQIALQQIGSSITQTFNDPGSTFFKWETIGAKTVVGDCDKNLALEIRVFNNATNALIATVTAGVNPNDNNAQNDVPAVQTGPLAKLVPNIPAGVPVRFETWGRNVASRLSFGIYSVANVNGNVKVGGLRIKKVTSNDGVSAANDVVKTYTYHDPLVNPAQSSGLLYNNPIYGYVYKLCINPDSCRLISQAGPCPQDYDPYVYPLFFESSVVPLGSFEGYHLGYSSVKESFNGAGTGYYNLYKYTNEPAPAFTGIPVTPIQPRIASGQLSARRQRDGANADVAYELYVPKTEVAQSGLGTYAKFSTYFVYGEPSSPITVWRSYPLATYPFRNQSVQTFRDGQLTKTSREYNGNGHLQVTRESFTNSDSKVNATEYKYPADLAGLPAAQLTSFNALNLLVPLETNVKVDNVQVKGSKTEFAFFDNVSGAFVSTTSSAATNFIRPYQFKNYEGAAWVQKGQIDNYHGTGAATGRAGLPKQFTQAGWQPETYEWTTAGLIKKRTFLNFNWQYEYAAGTRLVTKITRPDGLFNDFTYDKLMRLDQSKARSNNVVTTYTYAYPNVNGAGIITSFGYVKSSTAYTPVAGSGLGTQETFHYFDGLGRSIETVYKGKATGGKDQIVATAYDTQGRISRQFETFAGAGSTGAYQDPGATPFTLSEYESTPLSRIWKITPPSWTSTMTVYGSNSSTDGVLSHNYINGSTTAFAGDSLSKLTVTDGNGNKTVTFADKKGRLVLSRKSDNSGVGKADTYYVYDDKDRLVRVIPPGAGWNDVGLVYTYQYTNNDLISQKQVPGKAYEAFEYNSRDLPVRYQDGMLRANSNRWMGSKYDAYGRLTEKGVWASGSGDAVVLTNKIIENSYGSAGVEIDKLKTAKMQVFTLADPVVTPGAANPVLQTTYNYDAFGRVSGTVGNNHLSVGNLSAENLTYTYDHGDHILTETRSCAHSAGTTSYVNTRLFDTWGRITQTSQNLNGTGDRIISQLSYTDKDQLAWKKLGNGLQQVDYSYLPNGMLSAINGAAPLAASTSPVSAMLSGLATPTFSANNNGDLFREVIEYNSLTAGLGGTVQNNGNIGQVIWQVKGRAANAYGFTYDYLDRLTNAKFSSYTSGGSIDPADYYGESLTYDLRGNLTSLVRKGMVKGASAYTNTTTDNQTIAVQAGTNQAMQSTGTASVSGNVDVPHNHLNLPYRFDFGGNNTIDLLYDGLGNKLRKTVKTNNIVTLTRDYLDGIELKNNAVEAVYNEEGRAYNNAGTFRYEYALRDHLGNTRLVFTDKGAAGIQDQTEILSETHYYPFGKTLEGAWYNDAAAPKYRYLYNGKELHEEFGLNFYDYGARWYDPGVGSWWEVDPMAETSRRWSPYVYGNDNPLRFIDSDGRETTAYGGFTSFAEMAARHEAAAEQFVERFQGNQKDRDKNKKAATGEKGKEKTDLQSRLKEAGWKEGQPMPAVDGVDPDYTVESLTIPILKPVEWLVGPWVALIKAKVWARFAGDRLGQIGFAELQILTKSYSNEMNAFFKSGGAEIAPKEALQAYKELATRILNGTGGAPSSKLTERALNVQSQRLEMIDKALKIIK